MIPFPQPRATDVWPDLGDWNDRADRAMASRLVYTDTLLQTQWELLNTLHASLLREAARLHEGDTCAAQPLAAQIADYYCMQGRLIHAIQMRSRARSADRETTRASARAADRRR